MRLVICTPMYADSVPGYAPSLCSTVDLLNDQGFRAFPLIGHGVSHVGLARNELAHEFRRTGADVSFWADADESWQPRDALRVAQVLEADPEVEVVGCPYPVKEYDWKAIGDAARAGTPDDKLYLAGCTKWVLQMMPEDVDAERGYVGPHRIVPTLLGHVDLIRAKSIGTGFLAIRRSVFEKLDERFGDRRNYKRRGERKVELFGGGLIDGPSGREFQGEDWAFADDWRAAGGTLWLMLGPRVTHWGTAKFEGVFNANEYAKRAARGIVR